jgi:hypothetical protein
MLGHVVGIGRAALPLAPVLSGFGASEKGSKTDLLKTADCQHFSGKAGLFEGSGYVQSKTTTLQSKTNSRCFRPESMGGLAVQHLQEVSLRSDIVPFGLGTPQTVHFGTPQTVHFTGITTMRSGGSVSQSMRWKDWRGRCSISSHLAQAPF